MGTSNNGGSTPSSIQAALNRAMRRRSSPYGIIKLNSQHGATPSSILIASKSYTCDTDMGVGITHKDSDGRTTLTVILHKKELFGENEQQKLRSERGYLIRDSEGSEVIEFEITSPLLAFGKARDTIDLISATVYRAIGTKLIDEKTDIREAYFCGHKCFAINAPENACADFAIGNIVSCSPEALEAHDSGIVTSDDAKTLYIYLGDGKSLEDAYERLRGKRLVYILNTPREEKALQASGVGACEEIRYIEVCSRCNIISHITYKETENQNVRKNQ